MITLTFRNRILKIPKCSLKSNEKGCPFDNNHLHFFSPQTAELSPSLRIAIPLSIFDDQILAVKSMSSACNSYFLQISICDNRSKITSCSMIRVSTQRSPEHHIDMISGAIKADCVNNESFTASLITHCFAGRSGSRGAVRLCTNTRLPEKSINMIYMTDHCNHFD